MSAFSNPLLLPEMRPQLEAVFSQYETGASCAGHTVRARGYGITSVIESIFLISAVLMVGLFLLNLLIKDVPLRHGPPPSPEP